MNFGKDHPTTANSYFNLGILLVDLYDFKGARLFLEKAVVGYEKALGKNHPTTRTTYSWLSAVLRDLGDFEAAKVFENKSNSIR